jgi:hypothetical protein
VGCICIQNTFRGLDELLDMGHCPSYILSSSAQLRSCSSGVKQPSVAAPRLAQHYVDVVWACSLPRLSPHNSKLLTVSNVNPTFYPEYIVELAPLVWASRASSLVFQALRHVLDAFGALSVEVASWPMQTVPEYDEIKRWPITRSKSSTRYGP